MQAKEKHQIILVLSQNSVLQFTQKIMSIMAFSYFHEISE